MESIELFVPGRLCLFGEHSDWASDFGLSGDGCVLVAGLEQGIHARAKLSSRFDFNYGNLSFSIEMDLEKIKSHFEDEFFKYICGCAYVMLDKYSVFGASIDIINMDLPVKKGLSSSAAISVLVIRAFNQLYKLNLTVDDEMELAYEAERLVGSKCGRMDQICARGTNRVNMINYSKGKSTIQDVSICGEFIYLIVDLNSTKNTIKILSDLQNAYLSSSIVRDYLGKVNLDICSKAVQCFKTGDNYELGKLMTSAQILFDNACAVYSDELVSPLLHKILDDSYVISKTYGGKGVGSQGDGTAQLLVKSSSDIEELISYIKNTYGMDCYTMVLKGKEISKAFVPLAGFGTRMYPMTKILNKGFLPLLDRDGNLKPMIFMLIQELYDSGLDEIYLMIGEEDLEFYKTLFYSSYSLADNNNIRECESKFAKIASKLKFIIIKKGLGFSKTVYCCKQFVNNEAFLLVLGDQLYKSNTDVPCTRQLLDFYSSTGKLAVSCGSVDVSKASSYGILYGKKVGNSFAIDKFYEKPSIDLVKSELCIDNKVYAVFGEYILDDRIFDKIEKSDSEYITDSISQIAMEDQVNAFIVDGNFYDVGTTKNYCETFCKFNEFNK